MEGLEDTGLQAELEIILNPAEEKTIPNDCASESAMPSNEDNVPIEVTDSTNLNEVAEVEKQMRKYFPTQELLVLKSVESWLKESRRKLVIMRLP